MDNLTATQGLAINYARAYDFFSHSFRNLLLNIHYSVCVCARARDFLLLYATVFSYFVKIPKYYSVDH